MCRLVLVLVACSPALGAPVPKDAGKGGDYLPTRVGDKRVLVLRTGDTARECTEEVTKVEAKDGATVVTLRHRDGEVEWVSETELSAAGLKRLSGGFIGGTVSQYRTLQLPVRAGDKWRDEVEYMSGGGFTVTVVRAVEVGELEEVEVPAGKFPAVPVRITESRKGGADVTETQWLARGVGTVKRVRKSGDTEWTEVLKSFTQGK